MRNDLNLSDDFIFSQSSLQDYADCMRRFELRYIRDIHWPAVETTPALEHEERMFKGQEFHHLLHQHALGIPPETIELTIDDDEVRGWWRRYLDWQESNLPEDRHPELTLTTSIAGELLMAKYDIVARMSDSNFTIIDWKTGRSQKRAWLAERMQTIVYPYVLSRAGDWLNDGQPIVPENIRMIYWYAGSGETVEFQYSAELMLDHEDRLKGLIGEIDRRLEFPKTINERPCRFCTYRSLCERGIEAGAMGELDEESDLHDDLPLDLDDIEELTF